MAKIQGALPSIQVQEQMISTAMGEVDVVSGVRYVMEPQGYGRYRKVAREIAPTLEQAQAQGKDFYHPQFGWLRRGYKAEKELPDVVANFTPGVQDADIVIAGGN